MSKKLLSINLLVLFALVLAGIALLQSCTKEKNFDPGDRPGLPVISSFAPATGANGTPVTIKGEKFNVIAEKNLVTFNNIPAVVTAATATTLTVIVPEGAGAGKIAIRYGNTIVNAANSFGYVYMVTTFAGNGSFGFKDGAAGDAEFSTPYGLASDAKGNLYIADSDNNRIRRITPFGVVSTIAGDGTAGNQDGPGSTARFNYPRGLAIDARDNIYVADAGNSIIRKINPQGEVSTIAGNGNKGFKNGTGAVAEFSFPGSVALDAAGNLYITDGNNKSIRKITPDGLVSTFGEAVSGFPEGITIDAAGNLYVADPPGSLIRKFTVSGIGSILAGDGTGGFNNAPGTTAQFNAPEGIAIDISGNPFVGDLGNHVVRIITPDGRVGTAAGSGSKGNNNGTGAGASFDGPSGVAADLFGNIYVGDIGCSCIRKLR